KDAKSIGLGEALAKQGGTEQTLSATLINNNPWGNGWHFISPASNQGMVLATEAGDNLSAMALASKFGAIARVCKTQSTTHVPCSSNEVGTWVYIGIAPP
ncbi:MAG: hypothetical protein ACPG5Y_02395, partial [Pseudomonadales bacterium]